MHVKLLYLLTCIFAASVPLVPRFLCGWWYNFDWEDAPFFYPVNTALGHPIEIRSK